MNFVSCCVKINVMTCYAHTVGAAVYMNHLLQRIVALPCRIDESTTFTVTAHQIKVMRCKKNGLYRPRWQKQPATRVEFRTRYTFSWPQNSLFWGPKDSVRTTHMAGSDLAPSLLNPII